MASVNSFHVTEPAITELAPEDILLVYDSSTGRTGTGTLLQARAGNVVAGSTSAPITNNGLTTLSSAVNGKALTIAAPSPGVRKAIAWLNSTSTATSITASTDLSVTFSAPAGTAGSTSCAVYLNATKTFLTLELLGRSTSDYLVIGTSSSAAAWSFTTS